MLANVPFTFQENNRRKNKKIKKKNVPTDIALPNSVYSVNILLTIENL